MTDWERPAYHDTELTWLAIYSNIASERRVEAALREAGYATCYPVLTKWVRQARRKRKAERSLFVRYLFVGVDRVRQPLFEHHVRRTDGVERIVSKDGMPYGPIAVIPSAVISDLRLAMINGTFDYTTKKKKPTLAVGQSVRIADGPFENFIGRVKDASNDRRIEVLVELFKRHTTTLVDISHLRVA